MKYNEEQFFKLEKSTALLLNSIVEYLSIELKNNIYTATIEFNFPHRKDYKNLHVHIEEILAVSINQTIESLGQQIHNYKFLIHNGDYYLSLDPDESSIELTVDDQDFFLFKKLTAEL